MIKLIEKAKAEFNGNKKLFKKFFWHSRGEIDRFPKLNVFTNSSLFSLIQNDFSRIFRLIYICILLGIESAIVEILEIGIGMEMGEYLWIIFYSVLLV